MSLLEKIQELIDSEVKRQIMKYAQVISKKHDISLKLLLQDIPTTVDTENASNGGQCMGITSKKTQCKSSGKNGGGYCMRHVDQKKKVKVVVDTDSEPLKSPHVGHTMKECLFLRGCPACEKSRGSSQNLLIDI
jgi:hypothetical protein